MAVKRICMLFTTVLMLLIFVFLDFKSNVFVAPQTFVAVITTVFCGILPMLVAFYSFREHNTSRKMNYLLMGCGILTFAVGSCAETWIMFTPLGANTAITIHNSSALLASFFHIGAALWPDRKLKDFNSVIKAHSILLSITFASLGLIFILAVTHALPVFFNERGPTLVRQLVLWASCLLSFSAAMLYLKQFIQTKNNQNYWYFISLYNYAVCFLAFNEQIFIGDPVAWIGRIAICLGGIYAFVSILIAVKHVGDHISFDRLLADFFSDSETNYQSVIENVDEAVILVNDEFRIFFSNTTADRIFGFERERVKGTAFLDVCLHEKDAQLLRDDFRCFSRTGVSSVANKIIQLKARKTTGEDFHVELSMTITKLSAGFIGLFVVRDITDRISSDMQINKLMMQLQEDDKNKSAFIHMLSHELRNPMATIVAGISCLEMDHDSGRESDVKTILKKESQYMTRLLDQLLDVTRLEKNQIALYKQAVDVDDVLKEAVQSHQPLFEDKGVRLVQRYNLNHLFAELDATRIKQTIVSLLNNALKFSRPGGITVIASFQSEDEIIIRVEDNGRGIEPALLTKIFDPFFQSVPEEEKGINGLGLGLSIVKGIVELHGGYVLAISEGIGKGSAFEIHLKKERCFVCVEEEFCL